MRLERRHANAASCASHKQTFINTHTACTTYAPPPRMCLRRGAESGRASALCIYPQVDLAHQEKTPPHRTSAGSDATACSMVVNGE